MSTDTHITRRINEKEMNLTNYYCIVYSVYTLHTQSFPVLNGKKRLKIRAATHRKGNNCHNQAVIECKEYNSDDVASMHAPLIRTIAFIYSEVIYSGGKNCAKL